jgi:hypothetical protein
MDARYNRSPRAARLSPGLLCESSGVTKHLEAAGDPQRVQARLAELRAAVGPASPEIADSVKRGSQDTF